MSEHTPTPWTQDHYYFVAEVPTGRPGGEVIGRCGPTVERLRGKTPDVANAELIVKAVNAYRPLVEFVRLFSNDSQFGQKAERLLKDIGEDTE